MKCVLAAFTAIFVGLLLCSCGGTSSNSTTSSTSPSATQPAPGSSGSGTSGGSSGSGSGSGSGGSGTTTASTVAIAYVPDTNNDFDGARVDSNGNVSATSGSPYSVAGAVGNLAINNHLLLVALQQGSTFSEASFRADQDGTLTALTTMALAADVNLAGFAFDGSGGFAYVGGGSGIYGYSVNHGTGALTALPGSPFPDSSFMGWVNIVVAPNGSRLCAESPAHKSVASVTCFIRHSDGTLDTSVSGQSSPAEPSGTGVDLAITSDSAYLIWTDLSAGTVNASPIASGGQNSGKASTGGQPGGVAVSNQWIAVSNAQPNNLAIFAVNSSGQITAAGSPTSLSGSGQVAFSADGGHLFVSTASGLLSFAFNQSTGAVQPLNGGKPTPGRELNVAAE